MDVVYTWITVRNWSKDFFSAKPCPSAGHEVMSLAFFFIHLMDTVYSALLSSDKSVIAASLQHIDILSDKEQSVVYSCLVEKSSLNKMLWCLLLSINVQLT